MTDASRASVEALASALEDGHPDGAHAYSEDAAALLRALLAEKEAALIREQADQRRLATYENGWREAEARAEAAEARVSELEAERDAVRLRALEEVETLSLHMRDRWFNDDEDAKQFAAEEIADAISLLIAKAYDAGSIRADPAP